MARPIEATPVLKGKDADMIREEVMKPIFKDSAIIRFVKFIEDNRGYHGGGYR